MISKEELQRRILLELRVPGGREERARTGEATLEELRVDSLELARVLLLLQAQLKLVVPFRRIAKLTRRSSLAELVELLVAGEAP